VTQVPGETWTETKRMTVGRAEATEHNRRSARRLPAGGPDRGIAGRGADHRRLGPAIRRVAM